MSGQISAREDFKEEVRWLLKHDVVFMSGKERGVFHVKKVTRQGLRVRTGRVQRRDCCKAQWPGWDVLRRLERSMFNKYLLDLTLGFYVKFLATTKR